MKKLTKLSQRILAALTALFLMIPLFQQMAVPASAASSPLSDGIYAILMYGDKSKAVNVQYAARSGGRLVIDGYNAENNELFVLTNRGNGYVTLAPYHATSCYITTSPLDQQLTIQSLSSGSSQVLWKVIANSDGTYSFQNKADGRAMDVANGSNTVGNRVLSYTKNGYSAAQSFHMSCVSTFTNKLTPGTRATVSDGYYALKLAANQNKCVNIQYASTAVDRAACVVDTYNGENNEIFHIVPRGNNLYTIHPKHAENLCLNALLANPIPGYQITLHNYEAGDEASLWEIYQVGSTYAFRNYKTKLMLDDYCCGTQDGNKFIAWSYNGDRAQTFYLTSGGSNPTPTPPTPVSKRTMSNALYGINSSSSRITCHFDGYRNTSGRHEGIDFKYGLDRPIYSLTSGVITRVTFGSVGSRGLSTIAIYNSATNKTVVYLHSKPLTGLYAGQNIAVGQLIGTESWRGVSSSSGAHTHIEVRNGYRTAAAVSVGDPVLDNSNPTSFWNSMGYQVF